jgi:uncharacterized protein (DUF2062 family)
VADTLDHDPTELVAQLSHRILILQQQAQSLARFPANRDGKQQRQLLQQQIRTSASNCLRWNSSRRSCAAAMKTISAWRSR